MIKLTDVRIDAPSNSAHNILCDIVAHCGIESVLLSLSEIVAAQQSVQRTCTTCEFDEFGFEEDSDVEVCAICGAIQKE